MDASPDILAEQVRAKRIAIDNDLEVLRVRLAKADPRRHTAEARRLIKTVVPIAAGAAALWLWWGRRRRVDSLEQLMVQGLTDLYRTEHHLLAALERMRTQASNEDLANAFAHHRAETEGHIDRLERVFRSVGARPTNGSAAAVDAMIAEGERLLAKNVDRDVQDAWLISTAQRIEHLEIASYGTLRTYAETLGFTFAAQLLQQTLEEEQATDVKLTHLAERFVNPQSIRTSHAL